MILLEIRMIEEKIGKHRGKKLNNLCFSNTFKSSFFFHYTYVCLSTLTSPEQRWLEIAYSVAFNVPRVWSIDFYRHSTYKSCSDFFFIKCSYDVLSDHFHSPAAHRTVYLLSPLCMFPTIVQSVKHRTYMRDSSFEY